MLYAWKCIFCLYSILSSSEIWLPIPYTLYKRNWCSSAVRSQTLGIQCFSKSDSRATTCPKPFELTPRSVHNLTLRTPLRSLPTGSAVVSIWLNSVNSLIHWRLNYSYKNFRIAFRWRPHVRHPINYHLRHTFAPNTVQKVCLSKTHTEGLTPGNQWYSANISRSWST